MNQQKQNGKFYYGWVIAFCCTLSVCGSSLLSTGMSTNLNAMRQTLGLSNTQTSMILTVRSISAFVAALFAEKYYDRLGIRKGMLAAMAAGVIAFLLFTAGGTRMPILYTAGAVAGICYSYGMMMPASMLIRRWFNRSRGIALSIASCGTGLVSIIFAPLVQTIVNRAGIRAAFLTQAGVLLGIGILLGLLAVESPEKMGLEPLGGKDWKPEAGKTAKPREATSLSKGWYFALIAATALIGMSASPCSANYTNNLVTAGIDNMTVAKALSVYGFVIIFSKLLYGRCIDRIGTHRTTVIFGVLCTAGMLMLYLVNIFNTVPFMFVSMTVIGVGAVVQTLGYPNWVVDLDSEHYNHTLEKCQMGYQLGCVAGSPLPGILADATGSYGPAYLMFAACTVIAVSLVLGAYAFGHRKTAIGH